MQKLCHKCKTTKDDSDFYRNMLWCKECSNRANMEWRNAHPERIKCYYLKRRDENIANTKRWVEEFKKKYGISYNKYYYRNNKEKCKARSKRYACKLEAKQYQKKYRQEHREDLTVRKRQYNRKFFLKWGYYPGLKKRYLLGTTTFDEHRRKDFDKEQSSINYQKRILGLLDNPKKWSSEHVQNLFNMWSWYHLGRSSNAVYTYEEWEDA